MLHLTRLTGPILALGFVAFAAIALAQEQPEEFDFGRQEYESKCAGCHGAAGKGDGPHKPYLSKSPCDLTTLSERHRGRFPSALVQKVVDGRMIVNEEGPRDMPVFGEQYAEAAAEDYMDVRYPAEAYVQTRLAALSDYVLSLQEE